MGTVVHTEWKCGGYCGTYQEGVLGGEGGGGLLWYLAKEGKN